MLVSEDLICMHKLVNMEDQRLAFKVKLGEELIQR